MVSNYKSSITSRYYVRFFLLLGEKTRPRPNLIFEIAEKPERQNCQVTYETKPWPDVTYETKHLGWQKTKLSRHSTRMVWASPFLSFIWGENQAYTKLDIRDSQKVEKSSSYIRNNPPPPFPKNWVAIVLSPNWRTQRIHFAVVLWNTRFFFSFFPKIYVATKAAFV